MQPPVSHANCRSNKYIYIEQNPRDLFTNLAEHTEVVNTTFRVTIEDKRFH